MAGKNSGTSYLRTMFTSFLTVIVTLMVTGAFTRAEKVDNAASTEEVQQVEKDANAYTDTKLKESEEDLKEYVDGKVSSLDILNAERHKALIDKLETMEKYQERRFNAIEKRLP